MTINEVGNNLIDKVTNLIINKVGNYLIEKVANLTINNVGNILIKKSANLTINNTGNDSNIANASDLQVQFVGNSAGISHQNLLSRRMIGIQHEEVSVLVPPTELIIIVNNQPAMAVSTGVIQALKETKTPAMQEFIAVTTPCNTGANMTPR